MKKRYRDLIKLDDEITEQLKTSSGRVLYWQSLLDEATKFDLFDVLLDSLQAKGDIIEFGVWRGATTKKMAAVMKDAGFSKRLYACDSFEGFGESLITEEDISLFRSVNRLKKKFAAANDVPQRLNNFFKHYGLDGYCVKGFFDASLKNIDSDATYCFAHVDCDAYTSHFDCLEYVYPRISAGGCIVFDDYNAKKWPGATKAIDEFFLDKPEKLFLSDKKDRAAWYIQKL
jgi:O-methyltransferase